jgi:hypothetical protein
MTVNGFTLDFCEGAQSEATEPAEKMEDDVHAHDSIRTCGRTGSVFHGSGFGRDQAPGGIGIRKPG